MSIRNTKSANKGGALTVNGTPYTLARSEVFYFLKFIDYDKELFKAASNLTAKPTAVFYTEDAQDKVILDYSLANQTDKTYLKSFFANMTQTDTFNFTNGDYLDKAELEANIGCTLTYTAFKDDKIFANVNAVTSKNTALDVYFADYFLGTPQLSKAGTLGSSSSTVNYALVSVNPNTNTPLSNLGVTYSDVIEVVNTNADNNQIKFEITDVTKLNETEVIKLKPIYSTDVPVLESLVGSTSLLNLYVKGTTTLPQQLTGDLGCCFSVIGNLENNTEYQCSIRNGNKFGLGVCSSAMTNTTVTNTDFIITTTNNQNSFFSIPATQEFVVLTGSFASTISYKKVNNEFIPTLNLTVAYGSFDQIQNNDIILNSNKSYTFTQSDSTNQGITLRFSTNKDTFAPFVTGISGIVTSQGINSTHTFKAYASMPMLYLFLERKTFNADTNENIIDYLPTNYRLVLNTSTV